MTSTLGGEPAKRGAAPFVAGARAARRVPWQRWRDPRLGAGLLLIAVSVAGTSWVVASAGERDSVYVATRPIAPGQQLAGAGLAIAEVNLDGHLASYLPATEELDDAAVAIAPVAAGELLARSAVGDAAQLDLRPVPIPVSGPLPAGLRVGGQADLWLVPEASGPLPQTAPDSGAEASPPPAPSLLASGLTVREIKEDGGSIAIAGGGAAVQVLVPTAQLPAVLAAVGGPGTVVLAPVPGGGDG